MKNGQTEAWADRLQDPDLIQVQRQLVRPVLNGVVDPLLEEGQDPEIGYCCLGVGCELAGVPMNMERVDRGYIENTYRVALDFAGATGDAPIDFHVWLGTINEEDRDEFEMHGDSFDVHLDWSNHTDRNNNPLSNLTCVQLNDVVELSFPQIGDLIRYFGVLPVSTYVSTYS